MPDRDIRDLSLFRRYRDRLSVGVITDGVVVFQDLVGQL
jgi:hypothetical protein